MCKKVCRSRWSCILTPCVFWLLRSSEEECLAVAIGAYFLDIRDSCVMLLRIVGSVEVLRVVRTELMLPRGHAWTLCCRVFLCVKMIIYCRMLMITAFPICSMVQLCSASARSAMPSSKTGTSGPAVAPIIIFFYLDRKIASKINSNLDKSRLVSACGTRNSEVLGLQIYLFIIFN